MNQANKDIIKFIIVGTLVLIFIWWIGGIHIDYLKNNYQERLSQYDFGNCVYDGYHRSWFDGFGGTIYFTCNKNGIFYQVGFSRRINNPEIQMYGPEQRTIFPNSFEINR